MGRLQSQIKVSSIMVCFTLLWTSSGRNIWSHVKGSCSAWFTLQSHWHVQNRWGNCQQKFMWKCYQVSFQIFIWGFGARLPPVNKHFTSG